MAPYWCPIGVNITVDLLYMDNHEIRRFQRREPHVDVCDAQIDIVLRRCFPIALCEIRIPRRAALEGSRQPKFARAYRHSVISLHMMVRRWARTQPIGCGDPDFLQ